MAGNTYLLRIVIVSVLAVLPVSVLCSVGDRSIKFQRCVASCQVDTCRNHRPLPFTDDTIVPSDPLPWYLILTGWSCESNCQYHCTHRITNEAIKRVQDIRDAVYGQLQSEQDILRGEHDRWRSQIARQEAGQGLDPACDGEAFSDRNGNCIPLMLTAPEPLWSENKIRQVAEDRIQKRLEWLPPIDKETVQYFGKWAQLRVLGMQELFSVLFSLMNLGVQVYALRSILPKRVPNSFPLKRTYKGYAIISIVAWAASAVFHTRDLWWTERLDYFCAAAVLASGLFFTGCRVAYFVPGTVPYKRWLAVCISAWVLHVLYLLSNHRLDYSYNMIACLTVGVLHNFLWLAAAFVPRVTYTVASRLGGGNIHAHVHLKSRDDTQDGDQPVKARQTRYFSAALQQRLLLMVLLMFVAPGLELFDFPPILRLIDAHALWHLATVPISLYWYYWLASDARDCVVVHGWKLDQHSNDVTDVDDLGVDARHSVLPPPGVSASKGAGAESSPLSPAPPEAVEEVLDQLRRDLYAYGLWFLDALRRLRTLLVSQS